MGDTIKIKVLIVGWVFPKYYPHCSDCGMIHNRQPSEQDALQAGLAHVRQNHHTTGEPRYFQNGRRIP